MVNRTLKTLFALVVAGFVALPAPSVQALAFMKNPVDEILENMADAESVEFSLDVDVETHVDQRDQPVTIHGDIDGTTDFEQKTAIDLGFSSTDHDGNAQHAGGSMIMISNTLYLSETGGEWYVVDLGASMPAQSDIDDGAEEIQNLMNDLMHRGVVTVGAETIERINGTLTTRYAYVVNTDRVVDYLIEVGELAQDQEQELTEYLDQHVDIGGNVWIDTSEMLPVKFTMNIDTHTNATSYTNVDVTVVFESFNEPVNIRAPKHATNLEDADFRVTEDSFEATLDMTTSNMDIDGDGLTNADEDMLWHSNPLNTDTDGDGYRDETEVVNGYNPNGSGKLDSDADGLTDYAEMTIHWSNRYDSDTDNDGYPDGLEIANGYSPNGPGRW